MTVNRGHVLSGALPRCSGRQFMRLWQGAQLLPYF